MTAGRVKSLAACASVDRRSYRALALDNAAKDLPISSPISVPSP